MLEKKGKRPKRVNLGSKEKEYTVYNSEEIFDFLLIVNRTDLATEFIYDCNIMKRRSPFKIEVEHFKSRKNPKY